MNHLPPLALPDRLIEGYEGFRRTRFRRERDHYARLAEAGQHPTTLMIACVDSRVAPEVIFDADPGEMVVVRNVANLVPPYQPDAGYHGTSAAIEFAVRVLTVRDIVVMGHAGCSGVAAFRRNARNAKEGAGSEAEPGDFVSQWMAMLAPATALACDSVSPGTDPLDDPVAMELAGIRQSLVNLRTFPWLAARERSGQLRLHGLWFDVHDGALRVLDERAGTFRPLE